MFHHTMRRGPFSSALQRQGLVVLKGCFMMTAVFFRPETPVVPVVLCRE